MRADGILAAALADAMLAGPWTVAGTVGRMSRTLGRTHGRPRWLRPMAVEVLAGYPHPPLDRPRELAASVHATVAFQKALTRRQTPVLRLTTPTVTTSRPFATPRIDDVQVLAGFLDLEIDDLVRLADPQDTARRARSPRIAHYRYTWLDRPTGARLLEAPKPRLKAVQRRVLDGLLAPIPTHPAAHGFVAGRSALTGALPHVGAATVISLDLEHFFAAVTAGRVWGTLRAAGYPEPVAHLLTALVTHASPVTTLTAMPRGRDRDRDFRLRRRLAAPHLPQGAPTSPQLANLVAFVLDRRLDAWARAAGATYTRYADDLTFSGGPELARTAGRFVAGVTAVVADAGFRLNPAKTRVRRAADRQTVTGIVVNQRPNVPRDEYDRLRAVLHDCRTRGPALADREGHGDFRARLLGRISWVGALNPQRGQRLRAAFDAVAWDA